MAATKKTARFAPGARIRLAPNYAPVARSLGVEAGVVYTVKAAQAHGYPYGTVEEAILVSPAGLEVFAKQLMGFQRVGGAR